MTLRAIFDLAVNIFATVGLVFVAFVAYHAVNLRRSSRARTKADAELDAEIAADFRHVARVIQ